MPRGRARAWFALRIAYCVLRIAYWWSDVHCVLVAERSAQYGGSLMTTRI